MKLTRKQIKEGLDAVPIETVLLGTTTATKTKLTPKQTEFARQIALGENKASAYRKAYKNKSKPSTASRNGHELTKNTNIQAQIDAFKTAFEGMKYQTPAHLRALVVHKLTEKALDADVPPAQQIKALELLGKITEVALFTERREIVKTDSSEQVREKLLKTINMALKSSSAETVKDTSAEDLIREITGNDIAISDTDSAMSMSSHGVDDAQNSHATPQSEPPSVDPTAPASPKLTMTDGPSLHSIPHTQAQTFEKTSQNQDLISITGVRDRVNPDVTGGGGNENMADSLMSDLGKTPLGKDGSHE